MERTQVKKGFAGFHGLRLRDPLFTTLFNLVLEAIIRQAKIHTKSIITHNKHQCMLMILH